MQDLTTTFAGYQLHDVLSGDETATLYRATAGERSDRHGRRTPSVALLVSDPLDSAVDRRLARVFERRATAAMDIDHRGVARVLDVGTADGRVYTATAWRDSISLDQLIGREWQLPPGDALTLLRLLAEGLDAAHDAGIVHGALGLHTIRVGTANADGPPIAFVTGFGVDALLSSRVASKRQREHSPVLDEMLYIAPEQLRGGVAEAATDQYALACALYHCVSGQPPFVRDTASALFGAHLFARPDVTDMLASPQHRALRAALATGLAKQPDERHSSCSRLLAQARGDDARATLGPVAAAGGSTSAADAISVDAAATATVDPTPASDSADDRFASLARSSATAVSERLRALPAAAIVALVLLAGAVVVLLLLLTGVLDDGGTAPTASLDATADEQPAADGEAVVDAPPPEPAAVAVWSRAVVDSRVSTLAATGDQVVLVGENEIIALDSDSGTPRWRHAANDGEVTGSIVTDEALVYQSSALHAVALTDGERLWSRDDRFTPLTSLTAVPGGLVYGTGPGLILPEIMAVDPATGEEQWHFHGEEINVRKGAASAATDDFVTILQRGALFAIDPNGELYPSGEDRVQVEDEFWRIDIARPRPRTLTLTDDAVLFATRDGRVCSHDRADGSRLWCAEIEGADDSRPTLLVDAERVVVATPSAVVALDLSAGDRLWDTGSDADISAAAAADDGTVVVADASGTIRAVDVASGEQRWQTGGLAKVTALAVTTDAVYAGDKDGTVARLSPDGGDTGL